jgi:hypothetical protein
LGVSWTQACKMLTPTVVEVYSPPRITAMAAAMPEYGILPQFALDLDGLPWDFDIPEMRRRAKAKVMKEKPLFLVTSPMCTAF